MSSPDKTSGQASEPPSGVGGLCLPGYGRRLDDFVEGAVYEHPWEVTVDDGILALAAASFLDATPLYASRRYAAELGFGDRPVHPAVLLNLALSFSVHDVSEQAIAHLAYLDVRFPAAARPGDTVTARSRVLDVKRAQQGDRGVVHVETRLVNQRDEIVCAFARKALVPGGRLPSRPAGPGVLPPAAETALAALPRLPEPLRTRLDRPAESLGRSAGFAGFFEDFSPGQIIVHPVGKTVGGSEHMQLTQLFRNTHPLHTDELYAQGGFAGTRVVYGGLVLGWTSALASRDTAGNALWWLGLDRGAHPAGTVAGDTLYAASRVLAVEELGSLAGAVSFRLVGVKNVRPERLLEQGADLFSEELGKPPEARIAAKVVELTRTLLLRRRPR